MKSILSFLALAVCSLSAFAAEAAVDSRFVPAKTGAYPPGFSLETIGTRPKWLRRPQTCIVTPQDFRFEYWDPAGMMDGFELTNTHRSWTAFD